MKPEYAIQKTKMNAVVKLVLYAILFALSRKNHSMAQKQMAITIDDPNTYSTPLLGWEERNKYILTALDRHGIQAALFVCGMRIDDAQGRELLRTWDEKKHLICNHSYAHGYYNGPSMTCKAFASDFVKNDGLLQPYSNYTRLFRFPFLKEGATAQKRDSMRAMLSKYGYRNGYVTVDASDW
jgi:peptidoglycan-N-acetylglucosamine deacetylase